MKLINLTLLFVLLADTASFGQKLVCNIVSTHSEGGNVQLLTISIKSGDITLGRSENDYYIGYMTKGLYNLAISAMANYKIDSVRINFDDGSTNIYKAEGTGIAPEMVKDPEFWGIYFSLKLSLAEWEYLKSRRMIAFFTIGEVGKGKEIFKRMIGKKVIRALNCFKT